MRLTFAAFKEAFAMYLGNGETPETIILERHQDPKVPNTWAVRVCLFGGWQTFLVQNDAVNAKDPTELAEYIEDADFDGKWPPESGGIKFL